MILLIITAVGIPKKKKEKETQDERLNKGFVFISFLFVLFGLNSQDNFDLITLNATV